MKEKIGNVLSYAVVGVIGVLAFGFMVLLGSPSDDNYGTTQQEEPTSEVEALPQDDEPIAPANPQGDYYSSHGSSDCTQDCSGHEAGYSWAEENEVCDPDFDGGNSESFAEGVRAYAEDNCYYEDSRGSL